MTIERYFTENGEGTIEFTPIDVDRARLIYRQLIESLSYLRKKIDAKQNLLDITPKENDDLKKDCLEKLFMFKTGLGDVENQFQSVKRWFDKNKLPYPESPEDQLKKDEQRIILEEWISRRRKKVVGEKKKDYNQLKREKDDQNKEFQILLKRYKALSVRSKYVLGNMTDDELEQLVDNNRKLNGKINFAALGRNLGRDPKTIEKEIERRKMTWLYNPPSK